MDVLEWIKKAGDLAVNARNVELQGAVLEIKREVLQLKEENLQLRERNAELERKKAQPVVYRQPSYFQTKEDGTEDGPFCQRCYDADKKLIRTHDLKQQTGMLRNCPECKTSVWADRWPAPPKPPNQGRRWIRV